MGDGPALQQYGSYLGYLVAKLEDRVGSVREDIVGSGYVEKWL